MRHLAFAGAILLAAFAASPLASFVSPDAHAVAAADEVVYTCPMHPEVQSPTPGRCPKCGMKLEPKKPAPPKDRLRPIARFE